MKNYVIVGSGISGLVSAYLLSLFKPGTKIHIIDKAKDPGGLLRAFDYGEYGKFDYGMHNMLETSIKELDDILYNLLAPGEWQILAGNKRDLAGIYINGTLQHHTPYVDIRNLEKEKINPSLADFFLHLNHKCNSGETDIKDSSAYEYARSRFGKEMADSIIKPIVEKIHKLPAEELDFMATCLTPLTRFAAFDNTLVKELTASPLLRDYIAYTDQRELPGERSTGRKGYYPIKYGMYRVVDALVAKLKDVGVSFHMESEVKNISINNNEVIEVTYSGNNNSETISGIESLFWTGNIPLLGRYLKCDFKEAVPDKPLKTVIISLLLDKPLQMGDLYYFFCYDPSFNTFRLTNFSNYCEGAPRDNLYPISMEFLVNDDFVKQRNIEEEAEKELFRFNVTAPGTKVIFSKAEILESGFPMPSKKNISILKDIRNQVKETNLSNLELIGILAEDNLFFQTDVLADAYKKIKTKV